MRFTVLLRVTFLPLLALGACAADPVAGDAGRGDGGRDARDDVADVRGGDEGEASDALEEPEGSTHSPEPGSVTLVATRIGPLLDRHCDFDGDGVSDNAIADLGEPAATLFAAFLDNVLETSIGAGRDRILMHFPRVEDRLGPSHTGEATLFLFEGVDSDDPRDSSDDFSGNEELLVDARSMDGCGEPAYPLAGAHVSDGTLSGASGVLPVPLHDGAFLALPTKQLDGTIEPRGTAAELRACGVGTIAELGALADYQNGLSVLEVFITGGTALGVPSVPGIEPDVDVDGDGLERFEADEDGVLLRCIDGDDRVVEGRDCWQDPGMADAFSMVLYMDAVSAVFGGRQAGWSALVTGSCEDPPAESTWSECTTDGDCAEGASCSGLPEPENDGILLCSSP